MAFPEDILAPVTGIVDGLDLEGTAGGVPALATTLAVTGELLAGARVGTVLDAVYKPATTGGIFTPATPASGALVSVGTLASGITSATNPLVPLTQLGTAVNGVTAALNPTNLPIITGGPVGTAVSSLLTAGGQLPTASLTNML